MGMEKTVAAAQSILDAAKSWQDQKVEPPEGEQKLFQTVTFTTGTFDDEARTFTAIASTPIVDRGGDTIDQSGWELGNFVKNPVIPWAHDYYQPPVARATEIGINNKGYLQFTYQAPPEGVYPFADTIWNLYRNQFMFAFSVGFKPLEQSGDWQSGYNFSKSELLEISAVVVPANPQALTLAHKMGIIDVPHLKTMKDKIMATAKNIDDVLEKASKTTATDGSAKNDDQSQVAEQLEDQLDEAEQNAGTETAEKPVVTPPAEAATDDESTAANTSTEDGTENNDETSTAENTEVGKSLTTDSTVVENDAMEVKAGAKISSANKAKLKSMHDDLKSAHETLGNHLPVLAAMLGESDEGGEEKVVADTDSTTKHSGEQEEAKDAKDGAGDANAATTGEVADAGADHKDVELEDGDEFVDPDNLTPEQAEKVAAAVREAELESSDEK